MRPAISRGSAPSPRKVRIQSTSAMSVAETDRSPRRSDPKADLPKASPSLTAVRAAWPLISVSETLKQLRQRGIGIPYDAAHQGAGPRRHSEFSLRSIPV